MLLSLYAKHASLKEHEAHVLNIWICSTSKEFLWIIKDYNNVLNKIEQTIFGTKKLEEKPPSINPTWILSLLALPCSRFPWYRVGFAYQILSKLNMWTNNHKHVDIVATQLIYMYNKLQPCQMKFRTS